VPARGGSRPLTRQFRTPRGRTGAAAGRLRSLPVGLEVPAVGLRGGTVRQAVARFRLACWPVFMVVGLPAARCGARWMVACLFTWEFSAYPVTYWGSRPRVYLGVGMAVVDV